MADDKKQFPCPCCSFQETMGRKAEDDMPARDAFAWLTGFVAREMMDPRMLCREHLGEYLTFRMLAIQVARGEPDAAVRPTLSVLVTQKEYEAIAQCAQQITPHEGQRFHAKIVELLGAEVARAFGGEAVDFVISDTVPSNPLERLRRVTPESTN